MAIFQISLQDDFTGKSKNVEGSVENLIKYFDQGVGSGKGFGDMMSGLAAGIDPVSLSLKVAAIEATILIGTFVALGTTIAGLMANAIDVVGENEKMIANFEALIGNGAATVEMLDELSSTLPFTKDELGSFAEKLAAAGIKGDELRSATEAVASSFAMLGEKGSTAMTNLLTKLQTAAQSGKPIKDLGKLLKNTGVTIEDLAKQTGLSMAEFNKKLASGKLSATDLQKAVESAATSKAGPALERIALSFKSMMNKAKEAFDNLFEPLKPEVDKFMTSVGKLIGVFTNLIAKTDATKNTTRSVFSDLFSIATWAVDGIRTASLKLIITFARIAIAVAPVVKAIDGFAHSATFVSILKGALDVLMYVLIGLAAVALVVGLNLMIIFIPFIIMAAIVVAILLVIGAVIYGVVAAFIWLAGIVADAAIAVWDFAAGALEALSSWASGAIDAASNFISGLVNGITAGAGQVIAAATGVAQGAINAVKAALGIASPSKVMIGFGLNTAKGMAEGMDSGAGIVENSASGLAQNTTTGVSATLSEVKDNGNKASGSSGKNITIDVGGITISGVGSSGEALTLTEQQMAIVFERLALEYGV